MITSLGVFSENESVDELGDGELRFMSLGWVVGEAEGKGGLGGRDDRIGALKRSEVGPFPHPHARSSPVFLWEHNDMNLPGANQVDSLQRISLSTLVIWCLDSRGTSRKLNCGSGS